VIERKRKRYFVTTGYQVAENGKIIPNSSYVFWNKDRWNCVISGNTLKFNGKHPSGGKMSWTFVRNGNTLITNRSTFKGTIRGKSAWGTYEGSKSSNH